MYDDIALFKRFRFGRIDILRIVEEVRGDLTFGYRWKGSLSPELQVQTALRFFASGSFQIFVDDTSHANKSTLSQTIRRVSTALCARARRWIYLPQQREADQR